ncbi:DUF882 domain-containing protein [Candidatus Bealeia paramacronuclearis]|uniref:Murein endopeptidase K n=1 Tax=Candidatus Bealeia paramacronuclearis TaxID=1921001 RepID=A0ABZ2C559_9PROT|nr:hypothetical protein [Candidatus Bealeia paramacronuclearis]
MTQNSISRRQFLIFGGAAALVGLSCSTLPALIIPKKPKFSQKKFALTNIHTGESFEGVFWQNGSWVESSLHQLNKILRDRRNGKVHPINAELFHLMHRIQEEAGSKSQFEIICGYRSPETNLMLKKAKKGIAQNSQHIKGNAIDLRLSGLKLRELRDIARTQKAGGVGYYSKSNFVHIDIRPKPAYWQS